MNFFLFLSGVAGVFFLSRVLCERLLISLPDIPHRPLFLIALAWLLGEGIRGTAALWGYWMDQPAESALFFNAALGGFGLLLWLWKRRLPSGRPVSDAERGGGEGAGGWTRSEIAVCLLLTVALLFHAYMAIAPWQEWDEMVHYGKEAKEYALGLRLSDRLDGSFGRMSLFGSKLGETMTAQIFLVGGGVFLARVMRLADLLFCMGALFCFFRFLRIRRVWALTGIAAILFLMDVQKTAVGLKVDNLLMCFEFAAVLLLTAGLLRSRALGPLFLAVVFSGFALATRTAGIYLCLLATLTTLFALVAAPCSRFRKGVSLIGLGGILAVCGIGYLVNLTNFGNPFYPLSSPWPFHNGEYAHRLSDWKEAFNIRAFPPVLNQLYLIFHLAFGVSTLGHHLGFNFPPNAASSLFNNIRWMSPLLPTVFLLPLFWRRHPAIRIFGLLFAAWFVLWSLGAHYTRLFIAGGSLCVFWSLLIVGGEGGDWTPWQRRVRSGIRLLLIGSFVLFVPIHLRGVWQAPHDLRSLFSPRARHEAMVARFRPGGPEPLPTYEESREISRLLKRLQEPVVQIEYSRALQIFFNHGYFTEGHGPDGIAIGSRADCYLGFYKKADFNAGRSEAMVEQTFSEKLFDNGGLFLRCRGGVLSSLL